MLRERAQMRSHLEKVRDAAKVRRYTEKWFRFSGEPPKYIRCVVCSVSPFKTRQESASCFFLLYCMNGAKRKLTTVER